MASRIKSKKLKVLSLFSGGMGLDLGLESTGRFETVICVEREKAFCDTIRLNHSEGRLPKALKIVEADIAPLNPEDLFEQVGIDPSEIDVVVGGPPCQSFSEPPPTSGLRREGSRGDEKGNS